MENLRLGGHHKRGAGFIFNAADGGEIKVLREPRQPGNFHKVTYSQGPAWEFILYITATDGKRKLKPPTFDAAKCPTEWNVRKAA
jgi:hypothetical protein